MNFTDKGVRHSLAYLSVQKWLVHGVVPLNVNFCILQVNQSLARQPCWRLLYLHRN